MNKDEADEIYAYAYDLVGRNPPSDEQYMWVDDAYLFDLLYAICDLLYEDGCVRSSLFVERAIDEFLFETGKATLTTRRTQGSNGKKKHSVEATRGMADRFQKQPMIADEPMIRSQGTALVDRNDGELAGLISNVCAESGAKKSQGGRPESENSSIISRHTLQSYVGSFDFSVGHYNVTVGPFKPKIDSENPRLVSFTRELRKKIAKNSTVNKSKFQSRKSDLI